MRGLWLDVRTGVRELLRDRRFTLAATLALGLGIGTAASVFALINVMMIRDVPFPEAHRLVSVRFQDARGQQTGLSFADFVDWRRDARSVEGLAADSSGFMNLGDPDQAPERLRGAWVSANTFDLLRVQPLLGRAFRPEDDTPGAPLVTLISHAVWQRRYGADPGIVGRTIRIDDVPAVVVGVMPAGVAYPFIAEIWQPLVHLPGLTGSRRDARRLGAVARLAEGVDLARARAEFQTLAAALAAAHPDTNAKSSAIVFRLKDLSGDIPVPILSALVGASAFVLLICWSNLASLLLARGVHRVRDLAIRASLGASRLAILRQLLAESALLSAMGVALGFVLAMIGVRQMVVAASPIEAGVPMTLPYWIDVTPDALTCAFVAALGALSTVAFGVIPAWHLSAASPRTVLSAGGRSGTSTREARRWTASLLVAQLALTLVLLSGAALIWRGFLDQRWADPVIQPANLVTMRMVLPAPKYADRARRRQFLEALDQRLAGLPVVERVAWGSHVPIEFGAATRALEIDGVPLATVETRPLVGIIQTSVGYAETLGLPIVRGRGLAAGDDAPGREAVVIDRAMAERHFAGIDPIGRRVRFHVTTTGRPPAPALDGRAPDSGPWFTVVGLAGTVPQSGPRALVRPVAYTLFRADPSPDSRIVLLARGDPAAVSARLREEVRQLDVSLPLFAVEAMETTLARQRYPTRLVGTWFSVFAIVALVMALVGLFALTAHGVAQRAHEIGVRLAVGARSRQVVWLFLRRATIQLVVGVALGLAGALSIGQLLSGYLGQVGSRDPLTLVLVVALLSVLALTASVVPARRAARVDPAALLRAD